MSFERNDGTCEFHISRQLISDSGLSNRERSVADLSSRSLCDQVTVAQRSQKLPREAGINKFSS